MKPTTKPFSEAKPLIKEGDILLFRGKLFYFHFIPTASWFVYMFSGGKHTHAGIASWCGNVLECLEFREFKGGRAVCLEYQVDLNGSRIDVFRPRSPITVTEDNKERTIEYDGLRITQSMRSMTGRPYSWWHIFAIAKRWFFGGKDFFHPKFNTQPPQNFICSTAISTVLADNYVNLYPLKDPRYITPNDLAHSSLLQYMFSVKKD